jgi:hypothetical protein
MSEPTPREPETEVSELPPEAITGEEAADIKGGALGAFIPPPDPARNMSPNVNLNPTLKNPGDLSR